MPKITLIGAGSLSFFSRLASDILTHETTCDAELALVDIDEQRLEYAGRIADRIFKEGGNDAIHSEIDIPMKYGVNQCIGDTLTPGGIMHCLRTLPHQGAAMTIWPN